jgi:hypothetical protein
MNHSSMTVLSSKRNRCITGARNWGPGTVYDDSPEIERNMDKERKGVALIIDLDSVDGFFAGNVLKMRP